MNINHYSHLIGNVYQCIWGSHEEKVRQIFIWITSLIEELVVVEDPNYSYIREQIEKYCEEYKKINKL